jgi:BASS family bile acid:Na+ symporter
MGAWREMAASGAEPGDTRTRSMDFKQVVMLTLQVSIIATVFGFGLKATFDDVLFLVRNPVLLARSLLAMFVVMPVIAVLLVRAFDFPSTVEIALVALAISPLPPLLPNRLIKAGGRACYAIALVATAGLASLMIIPLLIQLLGWHFEHAFIVSPSRIATLVAITILAPLAAGLAVRTLFPAIADRIQEPVALTGKALLILGALALLAASFSAIWALVGSGAVIGIAAFVVAGLVAGHLLGGPDPDERTILALSTACRHPAIALTIASANFPENRFGATILLYLLLNVAIGIPYMAWRSKPETSSAHAA